MFYLGVSPAFASLLQEVRHSQRHAFAEGSHSNLRTQFRTYFGYCIYFGRVPLPADLDTVCGYAQFLSHSVQHPTIHNYLSGVKMLHILTGHSYPFTGNGILRLVLRGIHRLHPFTTTRAPPVTPDILLALFRVVDHRDSLQSTVFACALLLFFTMSRLGSVLPASSKTIADHFLVADRVAAFHLGLVSSHENDSIWGAASPCPAGPHGFSTLPRCCLLSCAIICGSCWP